MALTSSLRSLSGLPWGAATGHCIRRIPTRLTGGGLEGKKGISYGEYIRLFPTNHQEEEQTVQSLREVHASPRRSQA